ncbi:hypothetical protein [Symbiopectobacterium sp.]|uniref:hypothetical protein n=1 Tax=Symbiopectobacterium sp. TaxID=2952789 RepID=UPI003F311C9D
MTATVGTDGKWSTSVGTDALALLQNLGNGNVTVTVNAGDSVDNNVSLGGGLTLGFSLPVVTLSPIFGGDGFLNSAEALVAQTLSGVVTNAAVGSQVTVTLGSKTFQTTVGAAGAYSLTLQPSDLAALVDGSVSVKVEVTNASGNTGSISQTITAITKNLPTISLNSLFGGDGYLNVAEAALGQTLSGTTTNAGMGSKITPTIGGLSREATVQAGGVWSISVTPTELQSLANGNLTVNATVTDKAGNSNSTSAGLTVALTPPTITFNPLFGNGILDLNDLLSTQILSGTSTQAAAGTTLTLTLGGKTYTTTINAGGSWSLNLPTVDLQALADGSLTVNAQLTNAAGNSISQNSLATVAINAAPTITLNPLFGGDGLLNAVEAATNPIISGTTTNAVGSTLRVTLGSRTLTTVVQSDGTWSVGLSATDLTALTDGNLTLGVSLETSHTAATSHETSTTHDDSTLTLASLNEVQSTGASATVTTPSDISYSIGGVAIVPTDSNTLTGSDGDDLLQVSVLDALHIDGGAGTDMLALSGEHLALDLTALGLSIDNIEIFDLGASGTNSITLDLARALSVTDKPEDDLRILGATGNEVNLIPDPSGTWALTGQRALDGMMFDVYHNSALESGNTLGDVLVQQGLHVNIV